jgi:hypothetical protein
MTKKKLKTFRSNVDDLGAFELPKYTGVRWMMLPFRLDDIKRTITREDWHEALQRMVALAPVQEGVGYLTIDESEVMPGETHRRPGLHVDGVDERGGIGGWGGSAGGGWGAGLGAGGQWGTGGMIVVASHTGSRAWAGDFEARIGANGDCSHMKSMLRDEDAIPLLGGRAYRLNETCVHEALPLPARTKRQFVRLSMPSEAPWYEGYTRNPLGVEPTGPIHPARAEFMGFRP